MAKWPWRSCLPFSIPADRNLRCIFGANLVILAQIHLKLLRGQAEIPRIPIQNGQNDLIGQGQWPPFSMPGENIPECMFGANLVIPAQICDELSCEQGKVCGQTGGRTDRRTDAGNDNTPSAWNMWVLYSSCRGRKYCASRSPRSSLRDFQLARPDKKIEVAYVETRRLLWI